MVMVSLDNSRIMTMTKGLENYHLIDKQLWLGKMKVFR